MLAQHLALQGATNLRRSMKRSVEAVDSPQLKKERTFHVHLSLESFGIIFHIYILRQGFRLSFVLNLFLIFYQISVSCFYKKQLYRNSDVLVSMKSSKSLLISFLFSGLRLNLLSECRLDGYERSSERVNELASICCLVLCLCGKRLQLVNLIVFQIFPDCQKKCERRSDALVATFSTQT